MAEFNVSEDVYALMDANGAYIEDTYVSHGVYKTDICLYDDVFGEDSLLVCHNGTEKDFVEKLFKVCRDFDCREYYVVGSEGKESLDEEGPYTERSLAVERVCNALADDLKNFYLDEQED